MGHTKEEIAQQEIEAFAWMTKKGYDRKASKDIAPILVNYNNEKLKEELTTLKGLFENVSYSDVMVLLESRINKL